MNEQHNMNAQRTLKTTHEALTPEWLEQNWKPHAVILLPPRFNYAEVTRWLAGRFSVWSWPTSRTVEVMV